MNIGEGIVGSFSSGPESLEEEGFSPGWARASHWKRPKILRRRLPAGLTDYVGTLVIKVNLLSCLTIVLKGYVVVSSLLKQVIPKSKNQSYCGNTPYIRGCDAENNRFAVTII